MPHISGKVGHSDLVVCALIAVDARVYVYMHDWKYVGVMVTKRSTTIVYKQTDKQTDRESTAWYSLAL